MIFSPTAGTDHTGQVLTSLQPLPNSTRLVFYMSKLGTRTYFTALPKRLKYCKVRREWVRVASKGGL